MYILYIESVFDRIIIANVFLNDTQYVKAKPGTLYQVLGEGLLKTFDFFDHLLNNIKENHLIGPTLLYWVFVVYLVYS